jgi:hypothetical protein
MQLMKQVPATIAMLRLQRQNWDTYLVQAARTYGRIRSIGQRSPPVLKASTLPGHQSAQHSKTIASASASQLSPIALDITDPTLRVAHLRTESDAAGAKRIRSGR